MAFSYSNKRIVTTFFLFFIFFVHATSAYSYYSVKKSKKAKKKSKKQKKKSPKKEDACDDVTRRLMDHGDGGGRELVIPNCCYSLPPVRKLARDDQGHRKLYPICCGPIVRMLDGDDEAHRKLCD